MAALFMIFRKPLRIPGLVADKVEVLNLKKDILLPAFPIPKEFQIHNDSNLNQWEYLRDITYKGAKKRYSILHRK